MESGGGAVMNTIRNAFDHAFSTEALKETFEQVVQLGRVADRLDILPEKLAGIELAANATEAREAAHALAGMAGSYGLAGFEQRLREVMRASAAGDLAAAADRAQGMEAELDRSAELCRALLRAQAA